MQSGYLFAHANRIDFSCGKARAHKRKMKRTIILICYLPVDGDEGSEVVPMMNVDFVRL